MHSYGIQGKVQIGLDPILQTGNKQSMLNHLQITLKTVKHAIFQGSGLGLCISSYSSPLHSAVLTTQLKIMKCMWKELPNAAESTAVEAGSISSPDTA